MMISDMELIHRMALVSCKGIGAQRARIIIEKIGSAIDAYQLIPKGEIGNVSPFIRERIASMKPQIEQSKREYDQLKSLDIDVLSQDCPDYPSRLRHCKDAPFILYAKGKAPENNQRVISVVGTRKPSKEGINQCRALLEGFQSMDIQVVSGLALGIDTVAHQTALDLGLHTEAVVAHGLDQIYPQQNKKLFDRIHNEGRLLSEFKIGVKPYPRHFPMRNRIVAGMSDATIVIESTLKGGSMITANLAHSYDRMVMAYPGRVSDKGYSGCHSLIKTLRASLIENAADVAENLGWSFKESPSRQTTKNSKKKWNALTLEEQKVFTLIESIPNLHVDAIQHQTHYHPSKLASILLGLELSGLVKAKPGQSYSVN